VVKTGAHQVVETVGPPWRPGAVYGDDEIAFCRADADAEAVGRLLGEAGIGRVVEVGDAGSGLRSGLFAGPGENGEGHHGDEGEKSHIAMLACRKPVRYSVATPRQGDSDGQLDRP